MTKTSGLIVFSDLDGSLLDHDTYAWDEARSAVYALTLHGIPLVLVTSKTRAEVVPLRAELCNDHPFIVENGAATYIPPGYFPDVTRSTAHVDAMHAPGPGRSALNEVIEDARRRGGFRFRSFLEMGTDGIALSTGLDRSSAEAANDRYGSEPLLWQDDEAKRAKFIELMKQAGLRCVQGGRFLHVMGQFDKADAMTELVRQYAESMPVQPVVAAIGDGPNDLSMLAAANIAVVIQSAHDHPMPLPDASRVIRTSRPGPAGWRDAVLRLLREFES